MPLSIFIDTTILVAFSNERDEKHGDAVALVKKIAGGEFGQSFASEYVFDELVTNIFFRTKNFRKAVEAGETLLNSDAVLLPVSTECFKKAWNAFKKYAALSFTDCVIIQLMNEQGISKLASFDDGFNRVKGIEVISEGE